MQTFLNINIKHKYLTNTQNTFATKTNVQYSI